MAKGRGEQFRWPPSGEGQIKYQAVECSVSDWERVLPGLARSSSAELTNEHVSGELSTLEMGCLLYLTACSTQITQSSTYLGLSSAGPAHKTQGEAGLSFRYDNFICISSSDFNSYCPRGSRCSSCLQISNCLIPSEACLWCLRF